MSNRVISVLRRQDVCLPTFSSPTLQVSPVTRDIHIVLVNDQNARLCLRLLRSFTHLCYSPILLTYFTHLFCSPILHSMYTLIHFSVLCYTPALQAGELWYALFIDDCLTYWWLFIDPLTLVLIYCRLFIDPLTPVDLLATVFWPIDACIDLLMTVYWPIGASIDLLMNV